MKKYLKFSLPLLMSVGLVANAQNAKAPETSKALYTATLGENGYKNGSRVSVNKLDSLLALPIYLTDTAGNTYLSEGYEFLYAERGAYEDSTGKPVILTDYLSINVFGSTIPVFFADEIRTLYKAGDTLIYGHIMGKKLGAEKPETITSTPIKIVITR